MIVYYAILRHCATHLEYPNQWRSQKLVLELQIYMFALKYLLILHFCIKSLKIQLHLVLSSAGLGVQMPHCTPSGYATDPKIRNYIYPKALW